MSYIDAIHDRDSDKIYVVERTIDGKRTYKEYPANYTFYYSDPKGKYRSIFGDSVNKFSSRKRSEFAKVRRIHGNKKLFESDINVVFRCLSENYLKYRINLLQGSRKNCSPCKSCDVNGTKFGEQSFNVFKQILKLNV